MGFRKLSPGIKAKWLKALRSDDFTQGKNQLCKPELQSFCCLGVLACVKGRLADNEGLGIDFSPDFREDGKFDNNLRLSPKEKLNPGSGFVPPSWVDVKAQKKLAKMNDDGKSFKQIASYIARYL